MKDYSNSGRSIFLLLTLFALLIGASPTWAKQTLPYSYGFEESSPTGWTKTSCHNNTNNYNQGTSGSHNGSYVFRFYYNTNPPQYLISPELATSTNGINVSFWYKAYGTSYEESFKLGYSSTNTDVESFTWEDEVKTNSTTWTEYSTTCPAGTKYVCIAYTANDKYYLYIDDFYVEEALSCAKPKTLAAADITSNSVKLSWTSYANAWNVSYKKTSDSDWTTISVSENPYTLSGLDASTNYEVKVQTDCGGGDLSDWSNTVSFLTLQVATSVGNGYTDDFESACNWALVNGTLTNAWAWGEATNNGGSKALYISNDGGTTNAYSNNSAAMVYASKLFSFDGGTYTFTYDWLCNGESTYDYMRVALVPATVALTAGTTVPSGFSTSALPTGWIALDGGSKLNQATSWQHKLIELAIEEGSYYVVFAWRDDTSGGSNPPAAIDNFSISVQSCPTPTGLAVSDITAHGAKLTWDNSSNTWEVYCTTEEGTPDANVTVTGTADTNSFTFSGLAGETKYYVWVRSVSGEDKSEWAGTNFTTLISCAKPTALAASNITSSGATLTWTAGAAGQDNWEVEYSTASDFTVSQTISASPEATATLSSLTAGTTYYIRVRANCGGGDYSKWTDAISFTTLQMATVADDGYTDNFETANNWLLINGTQTNGWAWGEATKKDGEKSIYISNDGGTTNAYTNTETYVYATKLFSFAGGAYTFAYDWKCVGESKYDYLRVALVPSTVTLTAGTNAGFSSNNTNLPSGWISLDESSKLSASSEWTHKNVELNVEPGQYNVVFVWVNDGSSSNGVPAAVDNFSVSVLSCPTPTGLAVSDITAHEATLTWATSNNTWEVYHSTSNEAPDANVTVTGTTETNSYTFTNLKGATTYYVWVRSVSGENKSEWVGTNLTTEPSCIAPSSLAVSAITDNSVTLTWTDETEGQDTWQVSYSTTSGAPNDGTIVKVNAKTAEITGLTAGTTYYAYVRAFCAEDDQSAWSEVCSFEPGVFTANNGTSTNSYVPLYGYYADNSTGIRSQFIIPSTSLSAIANSEITKLVFHTSQSSVSWGNNVSFDVYMKEVEETAFESATLVDWTSLDKVYTGKLSVTGNKMTIELPEAFEYTGGNLMMGICQTTKGSEGSVTWYGTTTEDYVAIGGYATSLYRYQFLPKVSFTFSPIANGPKMVLSTDALDFGMVSPNAPEEAKQLTFTIKNKGKSDMTDINVTCTGDAFTTTEVSDASIAVGGDDITVTVTINTENPGDYTGTITVSAASIESQTINVSGTVLDPTKMFEDFAGNALPDFWTTKSIGSYAGSWNFANGYAQYTTSNYASSLNNYKSALVSPEEMTFTDNEKVKFMVKKDKQFEQYESYLLVQYTADGTTWTDVAEGAFETADFSDDFELKEVTIPATAKQIRFVACGVSIDNIYGGTLPSGARFAINTDGTTQDFGFVEQDGEAEKTYTVTNDGNSDLYLSLDASEGFSIEGGNALLFTSNKGWNSVYVHAWNGKGDLTTWPGNPATYVGKNGNNEDQYAFIVPEGATGIVIDNGGTEQTQDINNFDVTGYYLTGDLYDGNKYWAESWGTAPSALKVAAGGSETFTVKMSTEATGQKSGNVKLAFQAIGQTEFTIPVTGYVLDTDAILVDFDGNQLPDGWTKSSSMYIYGNEIYTNSYVQSLTSPSITVAEGEKLMIYARGTATAYAELNVQTSTDNGATWTTAKTFTTELRTGTSNKVILYVDNIAAGNYKLRFYGDYFGIDIINGYHYNQEAPALGVTLAGTNITTGYEDNFGLKVKAQPEAHTYTIKNTGTGTLTGTITSSVPDHFTVSKSEFSLAKDETLDFDLSLVFDENYDEKASVITIHPTNEGLADIVINASATTKDPNIWEEDFENGIPSTWINESNAWSATYNHEGQAGPSSNSTAALITPRLLATEGQVLQFDVIDAESTTYFLKAEYSTDRTNWTLIENYTTSGTKEFTAPADGNYYLRFTGYYTYVDNFYGFKENNPEHDAYITAKNIPATGTQYVEYTATATVKELTGKEEELTAKFYIGETQYGETVVETVTAKGTKTFTVKFTPDAAISGDAKFVITGAEGTNINITSEAVAVTIAAAPVFDETVAPELTEGTLPSVVVKYTAKSGWNTICMPFALTSDILTSIFGEGWKAYEFKSYNDGVLGFDKATMFAAGYPYIIYVAEAATHEDGVVLNNVNVSRTTAQNDSYNGATFQGTYAPIAAPNMEGKWGVTSEARIAKGTNEAWMKGFRAYFELPEGANGARLSFYDDATGITTVIGADELNDDKAYNLGGQRVQNPKKGLYIINGKKVVIK